MASQATKSLLLFVFILFVPHIAFNALSNSIWAWDQAWYAQESFASVNTLLDHPLQYPSYLLHLFGMKAPLIAWVSQVWVPIAWLTNNPNAVLLTSIFASALTLVLLGFAFARDHLAKYTSLFCVAGFSLFFSITREFVVEPLQMLAVSWVIYLAYKRASLGFWSLLLGSLNALLFAMAAKVTSPLYIAIWSIPVLAELIKRVRVGSEFSRPPRYLIATSIFLLMLVGSWYIINIGALLEFMKSASSGDISQLYGTKGTFSQKFGFWIDRLIDETVGFRTRDISLIIFWILMAVNYQRLKNNFILISIFQILVTLCIFSFQTNEETRYLMPLFPSVAALLYELLINKKRFCYAVVFISALHHLELNLVSTNLISNRTHSNWISVYKDESQKRRDVYSVIDLVCNSKNPSAVIGADKIDLNNLIFNHHVATNRDYWRRNCSFYTLGYAPNSIQESWLYSMSFNPKFYLTYTPQKLNMITDAFNKTARGVFEKIKQEPSWKEEEINLSEWVLYSR